jgi:hypothetical protein
MWRTAETNTHQDHVIAHVIGATVLRYFVWDETAYLLLDIGFVWNIYLDAEMGLLPEALALAELDVEDELRHWEQLTSPSPIQSVDLFESDSGRRLVLNCEESVMILETSFDTREIHLTGKE